MSLRSDGKFGSPSRPDGDPSPLDAEIVAERPAALAVCVGASKRPSRVEEAADASDTFLMARKLCGLPGHRFVMEDCALSLDVLARVGARPKT
ncbi:hypothetical protein [Sphingosinicella sp. CPCC 101087]|uniref:hypothetical protein n=1 Tax=Sphingosinicella sp. CPCC 101087 TaxID=2497754 RepID=UPI00101C9834|nr:hypothetical protein [Sphingosinicella sp. CPCC 101087]